MDSIEQARHDYPTLRAFFLDDQWLQTCLEQQGDSTYVPDDSAALP